MKDSAYLKGFGRTATHLMALGVKPNHAYKFQQHVERLVKTRGTKGAIAWLDSFGSLVSEEKFKIRLRRKTWVSRKWLRVFKRYGKKELHQRLTKIKRAITEQSITADQANKFLSAVHRSPVDEKPLKDAKRLVSIGVDTMLGLFPRYHDWKPQSCYPAYVKRELTKGIKEHEAYLAANRKVARDIAKSKLLGLTGLDPVRETLLPLNTFEVERMAIEGLRFVGDVSAFADTPSVPVGTLNVTQEPGGKARFFASPDLLYQEALEPLQEYLMACLHATPQDACYNAPDAVEDIRRRLELGQTVYTYDLTQATDAFPSQLTWHALVETHRIPHAHLDLLIRVSRGIWKVAEDVRKSGFFDSTVTWTVGQPLGTKPSFAAFAFSHHCLIRGIARSLGRDPNCYYMIGDDIVIFDPVVARRYRAVMLALGVQMPEEKSMVSNRISEFGGQTILRSEAFYPGKWREVNDSSLFSFIVDPAYEIERVVPHLWLRLIRRMKETPYPFGLKRPQLETLSHDEIESLAGTIELLFVKRTLTPSGTDTQRPDWLNNVSLTKRLAWASDWATVLYPHDGKRVSADRLTFTARVYRANDDLTFGDRMFPKSGSFATLFWKECWFTTWLENGFPDTPDDEAAVLYRSFVGLTDNQKRDLIIACRLIRSILWSAHAEVVDVRTWVDCIPFLRDIFITSRREIGHIDLVHAVISGFPHFEIEDFHVIRSRFIAILRRYGKPTEVLPSLALQLPRLRVGSSTRTTTSLSS
jgi:hypothetical protein